MKKGNIVFFIFLVLVVLGSYFYFSGKRKISPSIKKISPSPSLSSSNQSVKEFTLTAKNWAFTPSQIKVKQGEKLRLKIKSVDVTHGFFLPDFNINENLEPGKEKIVEFVADKKGKFSFICSVYCGDGHSQMRGELIVE